VGPVGRLQNHRVAHHRSCEQNAGSDVQATKGIWGFLGGGALTNKNIQDFWEAVCPARDKGIRVGEEFVLYLNILYGCVDS